MSDIFGWIATAIMVLASIDIAHKNIRGLWLMALGNMFWLITGYLSGLYSLIAVSIVMTVLDFYGIYKWKLQTRNDLIDQLCVKHDVFCHESMRKACQGIPVYQLETWFIQTKNKSIYRSFFKSSIK